MINLRTLKFDDYPAVIKLWRLAKLDYKPKGRDSEEQFKKQLALYPDLYIGLFNGKNMIGVALGTDDGRKGWINRVAVHPDYRRRGYATRLIKELESRFKKRGIMIIGVLIEEWNEDSKKLFEKNGYTGHKNIQYYTKRENRES